MVNVAITKFFIQPSDAETLAHEVLVDIFCRGIRVEDLRGYVVGAICNASRYYLRNMRRADQLPDSIVQKPDPRLEGAAERWLDQMAAREAFALLTARAKQALGLRYLEGYSIPEMAQELGKSKKYTAKLVSESLRQAERRYTRQANPHEPPPPPRRKKKEPLPS
jgi:RNA polymerase sigma factor (sigma-70 family)